MQSFAFAQRPGFRTRTVILVTTLTDFDRELIVNPARPGRVEPRVIKRRMKKLPLMVDPRGKLRQAPMKAEVTDWLNAIHRHPGFRKPPSVGEGGLLCTFWIFLRILRGMLLVRTYCLRYNPCASM